ncbi:hypothetical protein BDV10DRAFT_169510 [Aspergillus recurvatus]
MPDDSGSFPGTWTTWPPSQGIRAVSFTIASLMVATISGREVLWAIWNPNTRLV